MTELLQQAIVEIERLSPHQQDANCEAAAELNASRLLTELQDEQQWETIFSNTTDE